MSDIPDWAQEPLRDGEFDVVVVARVTCFDGGQAGAVEKVRRAMQNAQQVTDERGRFHIIPLYVPEQ